MNINILAPLNSNNRNACRTLVPKLLLDHCPHDDSLYIATWMTFPLVIYTYRVIIRLSFKGNLLGEVPALGRGNAAQAGWQVPRESNFPLIVTSIGYDSPSYIFLHPYGRRDGGRAHLVTRFALSALLVALADLRSFRGLRSRGVGSRSRFPVGG